MSRAGAEPSSDERQEPRFCEAEEQELASLFRLWREESGLGASEERQFARLLKALVLSRAAEALEADAFLGLLLPMAGDAALGDEEQRLLLRRVKPLLKTRELTKEEKQELAELLRDKELIDKREKPEKEKKAAFKDKQLETALEYMKTKAGSKTAKKPG